MNENLKITLHGPERGHPCYYCGVPTEDFFTCGLEKGGRVYAHKECSAQGSSTCRTKQPDLGEISMWVTPKPFKTRALKWSGPGAFPNIVDPYPPQEFEPNGLCRNCSYPFRAHGTFRESGQYPVCPGSWILKDRWGYWACFSPKLFLEVFEEIPGLVDEDNDPGFREHRE